MSLVYNNGKPIGRCEAFEIETCMGTSDFVKMKDFTLLESHLSENQNMLLDWMLGEMKEVQEYSFHPTGIIGLLMTKSKLVPVLLRELWTCMEDIERQQVLLRFLAIMNGYAVN